MQKIISIPGRPGETGIYAPKPIGPQAGHIIKCLVRWWCNGSGESTVTVAATNLPQAGAIIRADFARSGYEVVSISRA